MGVPQGRADQGGWTLTEVLIAVAVLAILVTVAVAIAGSRKDEAQRAACRAEARTTQSAVETFRAAAGQYPDADNATVSGPTGVRRFIPDFLGSVPVQVGILYNTDTARPPTYDWRGRCQDLDGLPSRP